MLLCSLMFFILQIFSVLRCARGKKYGKQIIAITRNNCAFSQRLRNFLNDRNVPFVDLNATELDGDIMGISQAGERHTFPAIFFKTVLIGTFNDALNSSVFLEYVNSYGDEKEF